MGNQWSSATSSHVQPPPARRRRSAVRQREAEVVIGWADLTETPAAATATGVASDEAETDPAQATRATPTGHQVSVQLPRQQAATVAVHFRQRRLVALSPEVGTLDVFAGIRCLDLEGNRLTDLPSEIARLPDLTLLTLARNRLKQVPECVWQMQALMHLDLDHNQITSVDVLEQHQPFPGLRRLVSFSLVGNGLRALPHGIDALGSLVHADLSNNPLRLLPCELGRLRFLQHLVLDQCPLHTPDSWATEDAAAVKAASARPPVLTLREIAARALVRVDVPPPDLLPDELTAYLQSAHRCSECRGPYFGAPIRRVRWTVRNGYTVPWVHDLCSNHWHDEATAVAFRFQTRVPTAPRTLTYADHDALVDRVLQGVAGPGPDAATTGAAATATATPTTPQIASMHRFSSCASIESYGAGPNLATAQTLGAGTPARAKSGIPAQRRRRSSGAVASGTHHVAGVVENMASALGLGTRAAS